MAMSRKNYEAVAESLAAPVDGPDLTRDRTSVLAGRLADVFAADNPRFDRARFLAAAGVES